MPFLECISADPVGVCRQFIHDSGRAVTFGQNVLRRAQFTLCDVGLGVDQPDHIIRTTPNAAHRRCLAERGR